MATVYFRDETDPVECDRVFVTETGWVAVTDDETGPVMYPRDRIARVEGDEDLYYDTAVLSEEVGSRHVDEEGHVLQEPELVRRMVTELEIF
ncbi:MAG: hypothetical protein ABEJ57_07705 [Halobacteriaceae archaeon]